MTLSELGMVRVAAAAPTVTLAAPARNAEATLAEAHRLHGAGVACAVFPELGITGYTVEDLFHSEPLLRDTTEALVRLCRENPLPLLVVGAPWRLRDGRLMNCGFVIGGGRLLGAVPKAVHPNQAEFYDLRWFKPGYDVNETEVHPDLGTFHVRTDQLFQLGDCHVGVELCEDLWSPAPPGSTACLAGAQVIVNLSASNELIAKADYRRDLVRMTSARNVCAYVYASAGPTESTKDVVFGGHCLIAENGQLLAESDRYALAGTAVTADVDVAHLEHDRQQNASFGMSLGRRPFRRVANPAPLPAVDDLARPIARQPFVPDDAHEFEARANDILAIQATGLARRATSIGEPSLVIGLSGGLDSTLAFLVCLEALDKLDASSSRLQAVTMPGPGTSERTLGNARRLAEAAGAPLTEIAIDAAVTQHLEDLNHEGEHDITFENAQARERTQLLFNFANQAGGIVVGTGDLSELALGWCTYNADHMASYNVNASVPKTLVAYLVRWYAAHRAPPALAAVLADVLDTPISPELLPPADGEISQQTEAIVGPYALHDFFLYHYLRYGSAPAKIFALATHAFDGAYEPAVIKHWMKQFFRRFFTQQFKRTTLPPGPKVGSVSLSPRGDWRMPDEADVEQLLAEVDKLP